jgi:large subunit ribosomal protein L21
MYAIVQVGGRQYRATAGDRLVVDRLDVEPGTRLQLQDVRMLVVEEGEKGETLVGRPSLDEVLVEATAVSHFRGPKILVFKYKPKKRYRRQRGFRAELTELRIEEVGIEQSQPSPGRVAAGATVTRQAPAKAEAAGSDATDAGSKPKRASRAKTAEAATPSAPVEIEQVEAAAEAGPTRELKADPEAKPAAKPAPSRARAKAADSEPTEPEGTGDGA